ncbi:unnamed protein product [Oikopleura dioica]|uniref:Dihydropteridine reductase n=1 Tax=Oikopleura dioica TaxID=34765 RepID=E4YEX9_OIKDI|nr:unnamed protein product [Oikopleura dioica]CBY42213.1 unnamed protein product [Oikopleura dioica]
MSAKNLIIYGGSGALGRHLVEHFKAAGYSIISVDRVANDAADKNVIVLQDTLAEQNKHVLDSLAGAEKVDAVINVAGGWCGGNAADDNFVANVDLALRQSVWTSAITCSLAAKLLKPNGLFILPGAAPVLDGATSGMIAYGASKAAVHHMLSSVATKEGGLPEGAASYCLAPVILDTPMNRKFMPKADTTKWTPLSYVAEKFQSWAEQPDQRPKNGSVLKLVTADNVTTCHEL